MKRQNLENGLDFLFETLPDTMPDKFNYEYFKGLANREIWFDDAIDFETGSYLAVKQIAAWNREDFGKPVEERRPIYIFFHSPGGDASICTTMIDCIKASKTPVIGINTGSAYSAAAYMFIACHKRYMFEKSKVLFHQGSAEFGGDYSKIVTEMQEYNKKVSELSSIVDEFTAYPIEEIEEKITEEWYINAEEALENGVCDVILKSLDQIYEPFVLPEKKPKRVFEKKTKKRKQA